MILASLDIQDKGETLVKLAEDLGQFVEKSIQNGASLDQLERGTFQKLLNIGNAAVNMFLDGQGTGDLGESIQTAQGKTLYRSDTVHPRPLRTIFGGHCLYAFQYSAGDKRPIELKPIDARINLPEGKNSYLLQEFSQLFCVDKAFAVGAEHFDRVFQQTLSVDVLESDNRTMGKQAEEFLEQLPQPSALEEGEFLILTADGKGVPLVKEDARQIPVFGEKERPGNRRMATLGCIYSVDPWVRTPEEIVAALFRKDSDHAEIGRPKPVGKHYRAYFTQEGLEGEEAIPSAYGTCSWLTEELQKRWQPGQAVVRIMDGQPSLWEASDRCLEDFRRALTEQGRSYLLVDILDIIHVSGYLWRAGKVFESHKEHQEAFVENRLLRILRGEVVGVVMGMRRMASRKGLRGKSLKEIRTVCNYLEKNAERMRYDEYLRLGYPIASGVIEGACRHIIKDRMERGGMRWRLAGAQAMLNVRCVSASSEWDNFGTWRQTKEALRVHPHRELVANYKDFKA
jgi:hypothetical protein